MKTPSEVNQRPDWPAIRRRYVSESVPLRRLAEESHVSFRTLAKRCKKEAWASHRGELDGDFREAAKAAAAREGEQLGLTIARLECRSLEMADRFLDRIERELEKDELSASGLRDLVGAFRTSVDVGRVTLRMDEPQPEQEPIVNVAVVSALAEQWLTGKLDASAPVSSDEPCLLESLTVATR